MNVEGTQRRSQDSLFDGDFSPLALDQGFRGPVACSAAGITYRPVSYTHLTLPTILRV